MTRVLCHFNSGEWRIKDKEGGVIMLVPLCKEKIFESDIEKIVRDIQKFGAQGIAITSQGGQACALDLFQGSIPKNFHAIGIFHVNSLAASMLMSCSKRSAVEGTTFLFHRTFIEEEGFGRLNIGGIEMLAKITPDPLAEDILNYIAYLENKFLYMMSKKTGLLVSTCRQILNQETTITDRDALNLGIITDIVSLRYVKDHLLTGAGIIDHGWLRK